MCRFLFLPRAPAQQRRGSSTAAPLALGITVASTVMFARVLALALSFRPTLARSLVWPIVVTTVVGLAGCGALWVLGRRRVQGDEDKGRLEPSNPFELWPAIQFGLLFAVILFVSRAAQQ